MTKAPVTQQSGNLATAYILADFGRFLRLHTADGDASLATIRSYHGNAAQFVAWCGEHGINPATVTEDDIATCRRESVAQYEMGSRQREYIGADSDKQAEVLARVKAHEKLVQVREVDHHSAG